MTATPWIVAALTAAIAAAQPAPAQDASGTDGGGAAPAPGPGAGVNGASRRSSNLAQPDTATVSARTSASDLMPTRVRRAVSYGSPRRPRPTVER